MTKRKLLALLLVFAMVFGMTACEYGDQQKDTGDTQATTLPEQTETDPVVTESTGGEEQTEGTEPPATDPTETTPTEPEVTEPEPTEPAATEPEPTEPEQEEVTLTVWGAEEDVHDENCWLHVMIKRFEAEHPEYKFTWNVETVSAGNAPANIDCDPESAADVYMFHNDQLGTLINLGALMQVGGSYKEQVLNDNSETVVNTVTYTDGQIYGFPVANNTFFMYYNKDVYTQEDVQSLDIMLEKGVVAYPMSTSWYTGTFFLSNGCTVFGANGNNAADGIQFGGQRGYEAAEKMIELAGHPNFGDDSCGVGYQGMTKGTVHAYFSGSWDYEGLKNELGDALGVAPMPMIEIGGREVRMKAFGGTKCVGVNPNADNPQLAMELAAFLASEECQLARYEMRGVIPAAKGLANHPKIAASELAQAEIFTMNYACAAQPSIPEMNIYWDPVGSFGHLVVFNDVNMENYKDKVDKLNERLIDF